MRFDFWSSSEFPGGVRCQIRRLRAAGHEATEHYLISEASYRAAKSSGARLFLRLRQYVVYPVQLCWSLMARGGKRAGHGVCVVSSNTFYAPLLATLFHRRVVHLVYDLFPEAMIHTGLWREGELRVRLVRWVTRQTLRRAAAHVFLGERLRDYAQLVYGEVNHPVVIPVGAEDTRFGRGPAERAGASAARADGTLQILYCGNLGHLHDTETVFRYWREWGVPHGVAFRFPCTGPKRLLLERVVSALPLSCQAQIHCAGSLDEDAWAAEMQAAKVALVTMIPGAEEVVMPSKTYSAMMAGQALLVVAPEASDLVDLVKTADCGWWVAPGDVGELAAALQAMSDPAVILQKQENAWRYAQAHFGQEHLAEAWLSLGKRLKGREGGYHEQI